MIFQPVVGPAELEAVHAAVRELVAGVELVVRPHHRQVAVHADLGRAQAFVEEQPGRRGGQALEPVVEAIGLDHVLALAHRHASHGHRLVEQRAHRRGVAGAHAVEEPGHHLADVGGVGRVRRLGRRRRGGRGGLLGRERGRQQQEDGQDERVGAWSGSDAVGDACRTMQPPGEDSEPPDATRAAANTRSPPPAALPSLLRCPAYCTAFTMSKIGRYIATTMPPTMTPRTTIMIGSMRLSRAPTATSTSSS